MRDALGDSPKDFAIAAVAAATGRDDLAALWDDLAPTLDALVTPQPLKAVEGIVRALRTLDGDPHKTLIAYWAATLETALRRPGPPVHLHTRVAHEQLTVGGVDVAPDEQVVVLGALPDPWFAAAAPLIEQVQRAAGARFHGEAAIRRPRSPVTRALIEE